MTPIIKQVVANEKVSALNLSEDIVSTICNALLSTIVENVKQDQTVAFKNLFSFKRVLRKERTHKNPSNGEPIFKPAHYVMTLDVKKSLRDEFIAIEVVESKKEKKEKKVKSAAVPTEESE